MRFADSNDSNVAGGISLATPAWLQRKIHRVRSEARSRHLDGRRVTALPPSRSDFGKPRCTRVSGDPRRRWHAPIIPAMRASSVSAGNFGMPASPSRSCRGDDSRDKLHRRRSTLPGKRLPSVRSQPPSQPAQIRSWRVTAKRWSALLGVPGGNAQSVPDLPHQGGVRLFACRFGSE